MPDPASRVSQTAITILTAVAALLLAFAALTSQRLHAADERNQLLRRQVDSLRAELRDTARLAGSLSKGTEGQRDQLDEWMIRNMRQLGFSDPIRDIKRDLMAHPELIPYKGTLGGTMGFYGEDQIRVLNDRWVLAGFEDGHSGGSMLLGWKLEGKKITWKRIESHIE
jgi:hypothetical protein